MNDLYANEFSLLANFFQPLETASKAHDGSEWAGKHGKPATPQPPHSA